MNLQEDYCSQELYNLLIEKGFEVNCYDAPFTQRLVTHQSAMKWLREEHDATIVIEPHTYNYIEERVSSYDSQVWFGDNLEPTGITSPTYEEAAEAAIKYCLINLI